MKEQQTARELQALLREQFGPGTSAFVRANPDNTLRWNATVMANPKYLSGLQRRADDIAAELRTEFDLTPQD